MVGINRRVPESSSHLLKVSMKVIFRPLRQLCSTWPECRPDTCSKSQFCIYVEHSSVHAATRFAIFIGTCSDNCPSLQSEAQLGVEETKVQEHVELGEGSGGAGHHRGIEGNYGKSDKGDRDGPTP